MDENSAVEKKGFFSQFKKQFWYVNSLELFERAAFYGTMSVLGYHVMRNLILDQSVAGTIWGLLYSLLFVLLYFFPVFSAALAEKYGYKRMLLVAFGSMMTGYFMLSLVRPGQLVFLTMALIVMGIGAGAFKPIISASIAHLTRMDQRNLAYSIYYWMINLGATLMAVIWGVIFIVLFYDNIYYLVFAVSALLIIVNVTLTIILIKNPVEPKSDISVINAVKRIKPALMDKKFVLLLAIYSGFWFMFAVNHGFMPTYMKDFGRMPLWFTVPLLGAINPGTIIIAGPFLGKIVEKHKSLNVMILGILLFSVGMLIVGLSSSSILFVAGILVFSVGEFITHPSFISYTSKIAPKDLMAIYMACIFIPVGLGNIVGGAVLGVSYDYFAMSLLRPKLFFAIVSSMGFLTAIAFIIYNRWLIKETQKEKPTEVVSKSIWTKTTTMMIILLFIPITFVSAYAAGPDFYIGDGEEVEDIIIDWESYTLQTVDWQTDGYLSENSVHEDVLDVTETNIISISFKLTWQDEADSDSRHNNQPDEFSITVIAPDGQDQDSGIVTNGNTEFTINFEQPNEDPYYNGTGEYEIIINCLNAGDHEPLFPDPLGIRTVSDDGNDWLLEVTYRYYESKA
jgi:dipeptide/tripeptide permease